MIYIYDDLQRFSKSEVDRYHSLPESVTYNGDGSIYRLMFYLNKVLKYPENFIAAFDRLTGVIMSYDLKAQADNIKDDNKQLFYQEFYFSHPTHNFIPNSLTETMLFDFLSDMYKLYVQVINVILTAHLVLTDNEGYLIPCYRLHYVNTYNIALVKVNLYKGYL